MRTRNLTAAAVVALAIVATACGGGDDGSAAGTTATTGDARPGTAKIVRFEVPESAGCDERTFTTVSVSYETAGSSRTVLRVDGRPMELDDPVGGTVTADVRCDPLPHDFVLFAFDERDRYTSEQRLLDVQG